MQINLYPFSISFCGTYQVKVEGTYTFGTITTVTMSP
jgi:hypothetical protein